jgi:hypothetical protein
MRSILVIKTYMNEEEEEIKWDIYPKLHPSTVVHFFLGGAIFNQTNETLTVRVQQLEAQIRKTSVGV